MKLTTNQERLNQLFDSDVRTDSAIADALSVSKQTISSWRHGSRSPKKSMLFKIAEMYNVDIAWLMGYDDTDGTHLIKQADDEKSEKVRVLMQNISQLNSEEFDQLNDMFYLLFKKFRKDSDK